ncbi:MAG: tetratricopeptide repeat protein [Sphingomonadaceae bacterium]|nr:tetratricopeptide repeat protein [Sphingomonadaceae bacterium]
MRPWQALRMLSLATALAWAPTVAARLPPEPALQAWVRARLAAGEDRIPEASRSLAQALALDRQEPLLRWNRFELALVEGDLRTAFRLAEGLPPAGPDGPPPSRFGFNDSVVALVRAVAAAQVRDWRLYGRALAAFPEPRAGASPVVRELLAAWGEVAQGDGAAALARLDAVPPSGGARSWVEEHRAHLLAALRCWPQAAQAYDRLVAGEGANVPRLRLLAAATHLEAGRGEGDGRDAHRARAIAILGGGPPRDPLLAEARARLLARPARERSDLGVLPLTPADGIALLLLRLAAESSRERPQPVAIAFARLAVALRPGVPEAWLILGESLARNGLHDLALAAFEAMPDSPYRDLAAIRRAQVLAEAGRTGEALARLRALAERPGAGPDDWVRVAEIERREGRFAAAAEALDRALALARDLPPAEEAALWFLRGSAREQAKDWARAEPDLRRAVALQPDNPVFLNYLGYSLLDRGLALEEADRLIRRAHAAAPDNGAIIDSLGWVAYVRGDYPRAVELLERARAAEPADPTVADHLGDALWRVGRRIEARHAWTSALALDPEPALRAAIERKLALGLEPASRGR